jgi:protein kinase-like protein
VADFGIAKMVGQGTELTMDGSIVGSPHYLSPEQVRGETLDGRSDIFSLGVVVYEMFGNQRPFQGESLTTLVYQILHQEPPPVPCARPDMAPRLAELLEKMLTKDREHRFPHAGAVVTALAKLERELPLEVLGLPASVDASTFEGTRLLAVQDRESEAAAASAPTVTRGAAAVTVVPPALPGAVAAASAPAPSTAGRRSPLPLILGVLLLVIAGAGFGGWWLFLRKAPPPPTVQTAVPPAVGVAMQPTAPGPRTQTPAKPPVEAPAPAPPAPVPAAPYPIGEPRRVEPRNAEPAALGPAAVPAPPVVRSEPRRPAPADPEPRAPATPEPRVQPPAPEPEPEPEPARPDVRFDREMSTGTALSFKVAPDDAVIKVRALSERRAIVIGRAEDYTGRNKETKAYGLPEGPGDYLITISHDGAEHVILAHAEAGRPTTQIVFTFAGAGKRRRGN